MFFETAGPHYEHHRDEHPQPEAAERIRRGASQTVVCDATQDKGGFMDNNRCTRLIRTQFPSIRRYSLKFNSEREACKMAQRYR